MAANADGSIIFNVDLDEKNAQKELTKLTRDIEKIKNRLSEQTGKQSGIKAELEAAKNEALKTDDAVRRLKADLAKEQQITSGAVSASPQEFIDSQARQAQITAQLKEQEALLKQQDAAAEKLGDRYTKITDDVIKTTAELKKAEAHAGDLAQKLTKAGKSSKVLEKATQKARKQISVFGTRLSSVVRSALIFTVITQALAKFRDWMARVIKTSDEASAAMAKLKGAALTMVQPIVEVILPVFTMLVNVATKCAMALAQLFAWLGGTSVKSNAEAAESLYNEAEALENVGGAAKDAQKQLAGFDEINKLSDASQAGGASDTIAPDFNFGAADSFGGKILDIFKKFEPLVKRVKQLFEELVDFDFSPLGDGILKIINGLLDGDFPMFVEGLEQVIDTVVRYVLHVAVSLLEFARDIGAMILDWARNLGNSFLGWLDEFTGGQLSNTIEAVRVLFNNLVEDIGLIFDGLIDFLVGVFTGDWKQAWGGVKKIFKGVFEGIADIVLSVVNTAIGFIKDLIGWIKEAVSQLRNVKPNTGGSGGIGGWGSFASMSTRTVPALANGAVIPANREFLAVLGDQKSGTNIETPLDTMVQAFKQALSDMGGGSNVPVKLYLDGKVIAETVSRYQRNAERAGG